MFLCKRDALLQTIIKGVEYCVNQIPESDFYHVLSASNLELSYNDKITVLNDIKGLRAVNVSDGMTDEFYEGTHWFTETIQADKSCAVLYNSETGDTLLATFYDKEADFFIVDYIKLEYVPVGAILKDPLTSLSECIVYKDELVGKYKEILILQGKED